MASCATTNLTSVWKDVDYSGSIGKVFIIGAAEKANVRKVFESEFVNQLRSRGIDAVPSNEFIPYEKMLDKETILSKVKELNIDKVLITQLTERKKVEYLPAGYGSASDVWYSYREINYKESCKLGYACEELVALETNLYDVRTEKLIWSALSETSIEDGQYNLIRSFIKAIIDNLSEKELL
jgi:hypothetical protein